MDKSTGEALFAGSGIYTAVKDQITALRGGYRAAFLWLSRTTGSSDAAVLFVELLDAGLYFEKCERLQGEGYFYRTYKTVEEKTSLKRSKQMSAARILEKFGLITTKVMGNPPKRHVRINSSRFAEMLQIVREEQGEDAKQQFDSQENDGSIRRNSTFDMSKINDKIDHKEYYNKNSSLSEKEGATKNGEAGKLLHAAFKKPSLEEVQDYRQEKIDRGERVPDTLTAQKFYEYYESHGWKTTRGRSVFDNWRSTFDSWATKEHTAPAARTDAHDDPGSFDTDDMFLTALKRSYGNDAADALRQFNTEHGRSTKKLTMDEREALKNETANQRRNSILNQIDRMNGGKDHEE